MIATSHKDCRRCDQLAVEAENTGRTLNTWDWTSIDGRHAAYWEPTTFAGPMGRQYEQELEERFGRGQAT